MQPATNPYDEVPYKSYPFPHSHPNRLGAISTLFGVDATGLEHCRVLELGCASGGNLIPLAAMWPDSQFVGIDLSARQVAGGQQTVAALGLKNIELHVKSIMDVSPDLGQFDYIICHGVYSWVSSEVREKILAICAANLAPQGVAYVSYNTYPGWHMRGTVRDMMVYHARKFKTPQERVGHARALLDFMVRSVEGEQNAYGILLKNEMELLRNKEDYYLQHEHLESVNEPTYFHEFEAQASAKGLQYLAETDIRVMSADGFSSDVEAILKQLATNLIEREQYLDFLRNRTFRQTLLCHQSIKLDRSGNPERLRSLYAASALKPDPKIDLESKAEGKFVGPSGTLSTAAPLLKLALTLLGECWPEAIPIDTLVSSVQARLYKEPVDAERSRRDARTLMASLSDCYAKKCVELHISRPRCVAAPGINPTASPLARLQAESGSVVTNLLHQTVELNDMRRHVLRLSDGTRSRAAILDALLDLLDRGEIVVHAQGERLADRERGRPVLSDSLHRSLAQLSRDALLMA